MGEQLKAYIARFTKKGVTTLTGSEAEAEIEACKKASERQRARLRFDIPMARPGGGSPND